MPKVTVKQSSHLGPQDAFNRVKRILSADKNLKELDPGYRCAFNETDLTGIARGNMFKASMSVKENASGTSVEILINLPLTLVLVQGAVEKALQKKLKESLTASPRGAGSPAGPSDATVRVAKQR